jgi:hypothetical protein
LPNVTFLDSPLFEPFAFAICYDLTINSGIFIYMLLTEEDKKEIRDKYKDNISKEVLNALKRGYPVEKSPWNVGDFNPNMISVGNKSYWIEGNKKYLVGKISSIMEEQFPVVDVPTLRRTVKFYLDLMK